MVCVSARTSVTAALMSMAMASILKVFLMRKKEDKGCSAKQRRRGREVGQRLGELVGRCVLFYTCTTTQMAV